MGRSVAGIVRRDDGLFLVAKRKQGGDMGGRWEFPGGKVEEGESDEKALAREFLEELGVEATIGKKLAHAFFSHRGKVIPLSAYRVSLSSHDFSLSEHDETDWVEFSRIKSLDFADSDRLLLGQLAAYAGGSPR